MHFVALSYTLCAQYKAMIIQELPKEEPIYTFELINASYTVIISYAHIYLSIKIESLAE